jgi:hypothetical protein
MKNPWWCADCRASIELDRHGRCDTCGSDAVDLMERPTIYRSSKPSSAISFGEMPQYAGAV